MRHSLAFLLVTLSLAALVPAACSSEGQGQPCDPHAGNSGNDDCQSGLVCTQVSAGGTRCCPQDRTTATAPECVLSSTTTDAANPTPPDSASTVEAGPEAAPEASTESGADATGDAARDGTAD
jgi:hypothetical protein